MIFSLDLSAFVIVLDCVAEGCWQVPKLIGLMMLTCFVWDVKNINVVATAVMATAQMTTVMVSIFFIIQLRIEINYYRLILS